mgnify:CR=1 FL=1
MSLNVGCTLHKLTAAYNLVYAFVNTDSSSIMNYVISSVSTGPYKAGCEFPLRYSEPLKV